ncbi:hypothetical protein LTR53_015416 [Teratosphaeriaceae sp. CCFEE 6253]|nr:hypothetical protein LTR53_015416 [Teratosphaeriaceae sp. CCFEE 6253]
MSTYPQEPAYHNGNGDYEKGAVYDDKSTSPNGDSHGEYDIQSGEQNQLHKSLKSRHMQMIAIGGAIGAGLFVGSGSALQHGGPGSLVISFIIIGFFLLLTMQALAELAVLYPVNGAFFIYICRFIERSWGFACGWDYAISWLTVLPFELTAAGLTISYWNADINVGVWIAVFLVVLSIIQVFGVRGYGEVEFVLSTIKVLACLGFIILGIIIDTGGVPTDTRGYIGGRYWHAPYAAFKNGFHGFCSNFVNAAFAFGGTELTGLAAAEAADPLKAIPKATKQVFWRIAFFYVLNLLMVGLIVPANSDQLLDASSSNTKASPFVLAITMAGIKGLPSVMNAVITISVISVANSCTFGSTRTIQALAAEGMAPKFLAYIDKHGRPLWCCVLQIAFGFLAFANEADVGGSQFFNWLLALSGLAYFFIWGSICLAHVRFRAGWKAQGRSVDEIPYRAPFGVAGSMVGCGLAAMCLIATFYIAIFPVGGSPSAEGFFSSYLTAPIIIVLYLGWKLYTRDTTFFIRAKDMDLTTGLRNNLVELQEERERKKLESPPGIKGKILRVTNALF